MYTHTIYIYTHTLFYIYIHTLLYIYMYIYISNAKNPEPTQNRAEAMGTCLRFWSFLTRTRALDLWSA